MAVIKDSGERTVFSSGACRDMHAGKGRCDLMPLDVVAEVLEANDCYGEVISYLNRFLIDHDVEYIYAAIRHAICEQDMFDGCAYTMMLEEAIHFEEGAEKYGENNWQKGLPINCYIDSAIRHYLKWSRGDNDERHDRAFMWNLMCCAWEVQQDREEKAADTMAENLKSDEREYGYKHGMVDGLAWALDWLGVKRGGDEA